MKSVSVLICGGRNLNNIIVWEWLEKYAIKKLEEHFNSHIKIDKVITGGALGADRGGSQWAISNNLYLIEFLANWKKYGKSAGIIRNKEMLNIGNPNIIIAFPGGNGTNNMIKISREKGIEIIYAEI